MISDELLFIFIQVAGVCIAGLVGFLGVVSNVINIVIFVKIGFSDTTNLSLLALAVADVSVSLPMIGYSFINVPFVFSLLGESLRVAIYAVLGSIQIVFCRISGLLTAFLALERFFCVAWPLRVKTLVTPKLTVWVIISITAIMTSSDVPYALANLIGPIYDPLLNETVYGTVFIPYSECFEAITVIIQVLAQMTSFVVVSVSTLGLIRSLRTISQWRKSTSSVSLPAHVSRREKQLVKMVILISTVFIVCSLPTVVGNLAMVFVEDFNDRGPNRNMFILASSVFVILNSINSMINIFVYVNMSSRFRKTFFALFKFN
ncbi:unnamed protein product [Lymnaea stagnalis]|uniref:G-protein coupled receptors family 1 profile domain-containing protein n=1 Tax=Lymnaea stagnalis TaxID=6523 RepID=A0AAV2I1W0_LYMST